MQAVLPTARFIRSIGLLLKLLAAGEKTWVLFFFLPTAALFFFKFANFLSIHRVCEPFHVQEHSFHPFWILRHPVEHESVWSNQYRLSTSRGSQQSNCFSAQLGVFNCKAEKHQNSGNWVYIYLIKVGLPCCHCHGQKSQYAKVWCFEFLPTLCVSGVNFICQYRNVIQYLPI